MTSLRPKAPLHDHSSAPQAASSGALRLLILDDDPLVGDTVRMMATSVGAETAYCRTATTFFNQVSAWKPTHILLDLVMPGIDGVEVIRRLGEMRCEASLIIVSGIDRRVIEAAQRSVRQHELPLAGALSKPFSRAELATLLGTCSSTPRLQMVGATTRSTPSSRDLAHALENGEIGPVFQPKVRCSDGRLIGYEALARWIRDGKELCGPAAFVPLAEQTGLAERLTEVIADRSLEWLGGNFPSAASSVAINVPAQCLRDDRVVQSIGRKCSRYGVTPERVVLEVTESGAIDPGSGALDVLTRVRLMGMKLSIDDFGVGYSSLVQLAKMPFSEIKIDRSFVAELCHSSEAQAIVAAIIGMSSGLGMTTVAEGVEDMDTYMRLRDLGCYAAQGYFIARPMTGPLALAWSVNAEASG